VGPGARFSADATVLRSTQILCRPHRNSGRLSDGVVVDRALGGADGPGPATIGFVGDRGVCTSDAVEIAPRITRERSLRTSYAHFPMPEFRLQENPDTPKR